MSALTKLFVVLLVVFSLLLCGAVAVFVNRVEDYQKAYNEGRAALAAMSSERDTWKAEALAEKTARGQAEIAREQLAKSERSVRDQLANEQALHLRDKADAQKQLDAANKRTEIAQDLAKAAEQRAATVEATVAGLLKQINDLQSAVSGWVAQNADLVRQNEIQARDIRTYTEQIAQLQMELARAQKIISENRLDLAQPKVATPDLALNGVINDVQKDAGGKMFATISLGVNDRVTQGMEFFVLSREPAPKFLAKFIVDKVDDKESFGHLEGPLVDNVRKNDEVRTKL